MSEIVTRRRETRLETQFRASEPSTYDAEAHTVELIAATGTRVKRYSYMMDGYYWEELAITAEAIQLGRVDAGQCPLLDTHSRWSVADQFGLVQEARIEDGQLILAAKFGVSEGAVAAEADVAAGTLRGVSIGYAPMELTLTSVVQDDLPIYLVTQWELLEVSLCPVPADPAAGVRSEDGLHPCVIIQPKENRIMDPEEVARAAEAAALAARTTEAAAIAARTAATPAAVAAPVDASAARMGAGDALQFAEDARALSVDAAQVRTWVETLTPDAARSQLLKAAADKQRAAAPLVPAMVAARVTQDERDTQRSAIATAMLLRHQPDLRPADLEKNNPGVTDAERQTLFAAAREWRGLSLLEMVRYAEEQNGRKVRGLTKRELADLAFDRQNSTSDFPFILANVAGKTLRAAYESTPQTFKAWMRRATAPDFKQVTRAQLGGAPAFLLVPEGGAFKFGSIGEAKEVYSLATYGRIFNVTRQVLINDDLSAFTRIPEMFGRAAADFESDAAYAPLIANPNMGDGVALFHATHGNLAGSGAAISTTTVQAGELAMMSQVGLEGRPISASPKFLLVSAKDKVPAQQLLTAIIAQTTGAVNPYSNAMTQITEVRLNRASGAVPWYMVADYNQVDTFEYAYLEGEEGVYLEQRQGFEVDGTEFKARLDFAAKAIDSRGVYQNPGT